MTRKPKPIQPPSDPITTRLKEAIYSVDKKYSENKSDSAKNECLSEENKRKKRRKSTPIIFNSMNKSKYIESETDDDYFNFCNSDNSLIESNELNFNDNSQSISEKYFNDEFDFDDDDSLFDDDQRKWNLDEKLNIVSKYNSNFVKYLEAKEFNFKYVQENGLESPLVFMDKSGLGMRVPSENFRVSDVKSCVGSKRIVDVVDVNTQKALTMSMKEWCEYYENPNRDRLLNVISLEFSHTKLENYVEAPLVVRQLDWIETAWPRHLRESHTESTNLIEKMKYPKVQKYVLMSVAGCYTDFHVDMGGTSVWYHLLKGEKIFWLIPPSKKNLKIYEKWILSGNQSKVFLPDLMDECQRIVLKQGSTFILPSGWIHGVYTSKDSLVFGGNFLHSFNVCMQLKIHSIETKTKVPQKFRYPFYNEMIWFVLERYVHCLTGTTHIDDFTECKSALEDKQPFKTFQPESNQVLNKFELDGLKALFDFLTGLNENKRCVPKEIVQPKILLESVQKLIGEFERRNAAKNHPANGLPFMHWPKPERKFFKKTEDFSFKHDIDYNNNLVDSINFDQNDLSISSYDSNFGIFVQNSMPHENHENSSQYSVNSRKHVMRNMPRTKGSIKKRLRPQNIPRSNVERRRRVRCHNCEPCTRDDCGDCKYCKDMKKFGGTGISKQCCLAKQCLQPLLPTTTTCMLCDQLIDRFHSDKSNDMYECEICFEIYHAQCFRKQYPELDHVEPIINEDLVNCWKCPNCVNKGYINSNFSKDFKISQSDSSSGSSSLNESYSNMFTNVNTSTASYFQNKSASPIDFVIAPTSSKQNFLAMALSNVAPLKPKRHRRTKQEMDIIKSNSMSLNENFELKRKREHHLESLRSIQDDEESIISLDSLTYFEKQIILREFCEVVNKPVEIDHKNLYKNKSKNVAMTNSILKKSNTSSSDHETIIVDSDDSDSRDFDLAEEGAKILNIKNVTVSTPSTIQNNLTNEFRPYSFDPRNEHIYHDDD
uniref:[histone H3]-dimethyl-L-lysine(36) demethylase n=1 Tax=Brachionus koreanus TaxID=1199090 RepID=A0A4Y6ESB8_9BILA|nr:JmjC domain-containing histone demethylation 1 [Brachionus koreanus]